MSYRLSLAFFLLLSSLCFGQDTTFHLRNYKFRTTGFRALTANIGLNGASNSQKFRGLQAESEKNFNLTPSAISFLRIYSSDQRWHFSTISITPSFYSNKSVKSRDERKTKSFQANLSWDRTDRFYKSNNRFLELGNQLTGSTVNNQSSVTLTDYKDARNSINNVVTIGIGKGRIEFVQDAQMANFILDDLRRQGLTLTSVTVDTYYQLARLITDINTRRIFDSRRRRIYELTRIDSFLRNNGIIAGTDIRTFTTINDNWALAFNPTRSAGTVYYLKLKPSIAFVKNSSETKFTTGSNEDNYRGRALGLAPVLGFEKYTPVNLHWQHDVGASVSWQRYWDWSEYEFNNIFSQNFYSKQYSDRSQFVFYSYYRLGFYPNNRTLLNANVAVLGHYEKKNMWSVEPSLNLSTSYFLGYRTRLEAGLYFRANYFKTYDNLNTETTGNNIASSFGLGLTHVLF